MMLGFTAAMTGGSGPSARGEVAPPKPYGPIPTEQQLAWHRMEFYAFVHFNMNTFTDFEWGHGAEDPKTFNPTALDCRQWARICKAAGMKAIILTAKHHDGFCLWPSRYTEHSVKSSPWRDGKGDVLRELADACREYDLKLGVYMSPWDRAEASYGDSPRYNRHFMNQLTEVLTQYGDVFEVWFDGACGEGPNGKRQVYDWDGFIGTVREHQPDAVIFSDAGPDIRWVGNERGFADETNWCTIRRGEFGIGANNADQTVGQRDGTHWVPAECDVSIRPGWYYHADQDDKVHSLERLLDIYYGSVGRGGNLLLNLPVDRRGLVHENDERRLVELRRALDLTFDRDLAAGRPAIASNVRGGSNGFAPAHVVDGDPDTYWATDDAVLMADIQINLGTPATFNRIVLQEAIALGQRIEGFVIEVSENGDWRELAQGTSIGSKRILRIPGVVAEKVRLRITKSAACPAITTFALYTAPAKVTIEPSAIGFLDPISAVIQSDTPGAEVHYTLDGSEPTANSPLYTGPITIDRTATVKASAYLGDKGSYPIAEQSYRKYDRSTLHNAVVPSGKLQPGLGYTYYEGGWQTLRQMAEAKAVVTGSAKGFDLTLRQRDEHIAFQFDGYIQIPKDGIYTFYTASDDGSALYIGNEQVVANDYLQGMTERGGQIALQEGLHPIKVQYFNATGGMGLEVSYQGPSIAKQPIPGRVLVCEAS